MGAEEVQRRVIAERKALRLPALEIRKRIGAMPFGYWVRCWRDGSTWCGPVNPSDKERDILAGRCRNIGFSVTVSKDRVIELAENCQK